jgi:hypothetical protein
VAVYQGQKVDMVWNRRSLYHLRRFHFTKTATDRLRQYWIDLADTSSRHSTSVHNVYIIWHGMDQGSRELSALSGLGTCEDRASRAINLQHFADGLGSSPFINNDMEECFWLDSGRGAVASYQQPSSITNIESRFSNHFLFHLCCLDIRPSILATD